MSARFWVFVNDSWARVTLKPGQTLSHHQGNPTDEGWSSESTTYHYAASDSCVYRQTVTDGRDCDGRLTHWYADQANVDYLEVVPAYGEPSIMRPDWSENKSGQRDYQAEAAGY